MKNKVLICDDEYLIRQGIEFMLDWEKRKASKSAAKPRMENRLLN